jgi:hypothetical protein
MNARPTPETDEAGHYRSVAGYEVVLADFARRLERERDEAREETIRWQSIAEGRGRTDDEVENDTQSELAAWELLREAQAENIGWQNKWQVAVEMAALAQNELATVTAQRDKLAEALHKVARSWNYAEVAQQALQSLTHNP